MSRLDDDDDDDEKDVVNTDTLGGTQKANIISKQVSNLQENKRKLRKQVNNLNEYKYERKKNRKDAKIKRYENKIESLQKELNLERD